jgi:hypothetical protein
MAEAIEKGFSQEACGAVPGLGYFHDFSDAPDDGGTALGALRMAMGWCRRQPRAGLLRCHTVLR